MPPEYWSIATAEAPRRGRPRRPPVPFNPRLLLIRHPRQLNSEAPLTDSDVCYQGFLKCGLCFANVPPPSWTEHLREHYGIGWIRGENAPDVENRDVVHAVILKYVQDNKEKRLPCRMCHRSFRCAKTVLDHIEACATRIDP